MYITNITDYFDRTVAACPDRVAVSYDAVSLTFAQLYERVLQLGWDLHKALNGKTNQIIAVYLPKNCDAVIANLAVIYSGNAYMNIDVANPVQRIRNICTQVQPTLLISYDTLLEKLPPLSDACTLYSLHSNDAALPLTEREKQAVHRIREQCIDTDPLCIINTSGSTGTPKAVVLNHRSFIDFTEAVIDAGLVADDAVIASLSPLVFDIYSFELCLLMAKGSTLVLVPEGYASFPIRLLQLMAAHKVSFIFWVPTIMVNIANMDLLSHVPLPDLTTVWFAGEVFPTAKFNYWRKQLPQATFVNLYGPIEITLDCVYHVITRDLRDDAPIPIGIPFKNTSVLVLNEHDALVRPGEEGELCIRGTSLAMGYYNNPQKTAAVFVQNPLNTAYPEVIYRTGDIVAYNEYNELVFKGRKDTLIKHMGYRIELAEIEQVIIGTLPTVQNCCAVYNQDAKRIALFYESASPLEEKALRVSIGAILPRYMVPAIYVHVLKMPRNINGKIDRLRLKEMLAAMWEGR